MQSLYDDKSLIAYKSLLTFRLWRSSVQTWHSPGPVVASGVAPSRGAPPGKPMPAAGETAHVRRLLVDRSRCGLEVSPAPPGHPRPTGPGEGQEWRQAANPSAGEGGVEDEVGRAGAVTWDVTRDEGGFRYGHHLQGSSHRCAGAVPQLRVGEAEQDHQAGTQGDQGECRGFCGAQSAAGESAGTGGADHFVPRAGHPRRGGGG